MTQQIIVITGTPGVGKTAIAKALAEKIQGRHINISEIALQENLVEGPDHTRDTRPVDVTRLSRRIQQLITEQTGAIVLDGHYPVEVSADQGISLVAVLRLDPDILKSRLKARGYTDTKIFENLAAEILDVCLSDVLKQYEKGKVTEINVTNREIEEVTEIIVGTLDGQIEAKVGLVDWLGKLENEKRLEEFFRYMNGPRDV